MISLMVRMGLAEDRERRSDAIRAFIRAQFELDREVRFKQVELQNDLLDLFVDVPIDVKNNGTERQRTQQIAALYQVSQGNIDPASAANSAGIRESAEEAWLYPRENDERKHLVGAAAALISSIFQSTFQSVVIEGAPGQGKSTITQFVCQVHRMALLGESVAQERLLPVHRPVSIRLPIRVDLRDYAAWLDRQHPFLPDGLGDVPSSWHPSLESFTAMLIEHYSGGFDFSVADLSAVARTSSLLLVLDGLDEVADIEIRRRMVAEITSGIRRLSVNAASLQVIITSRPAAFVNSPGFPERSFPHFQLGSINRNLIDSFTIKWSRARRLDDRAASEVRRTLRLKMNEPHLRDLARNPMQLTILLSLIHTRGSSLPDKRTSLYDAYVELFFNREAEKSWIVRENRDLLINVHRYLAWILHGEAENGNNRGSISYDRLHRILRQYLAQEEHDPELVSILFTGMVERVVALVSRVEGTYEFEVQPLREYFAARFLYETAPYSPPGRERKGTKPDRFDAIIRNFYWLNVARFYAGCFSKGELASLVDRLEELMRDEDFKYTSHPRNLSAMLLSDWVFSQHLKLVRVVAGLILDGLGLRYVLSSRGFYPTSGNTLILPKNNGRDELLERCFKLLDEKVAPDFGSEVVGLIRANADGAQIRQFWTERFFSCAESEKNYWFEYSLYLGILADASPDDLTSYFNHAKESERALHTLFRAKKFDFIQSSQTRSNQVIDMLLDGTIEPSRPSRSPAVLAAFSQVVNPIPYALALHRLRPGPLAETMRDLGFWQTVSPEPLKEDSNASRHWLSNCIDTVNLSFELSQIPVHVWSTSLAPWEELIENGRRLFGERWLFFCLSNLAASIKSSQEACRDHSNLFDNSISLCRRVRYARLRAGNSEWWKRQLNIAKNDFELMTTISILLTWSSSATIYNNINQLNRLITELSPEQWEKIFWNVKQVTELIPFNAGRHQISLDLEILRGTTSTRTKTAIGLRCSSGDRRRIVDEFLLEYDEDERPTLEFCQSHVIWALSSEDKACAKQLTLIEKAYMAGISSAMTDFRMFLTDSPIGFRAPSQTEGSRATLNLSVAKTILSKPDRYPRALVMVAEARCREAAGTKIRAVAKVAESEGWFED
jgi:hypothetical protein